MRRPLARLLAATVGTGLLLAGCGYDATVVPKPEAPQTQGGSGAAPVQCDNPTQSYAPANDRAAALSQLTNKDRLVVGVSADTLRVGSANPETGEIEGFDIDLARAIADALGVRATFRVISAADRIPLLESGEIDIVARNMTVNCSRWEEIGFSAVYYNASQKVLVRKDEDGEHEKYAGPQDLAGLRVCAPGGTTSIDRIKEIQPDVVAVAARNHTDCLVKFQQGEVEAITGDDTVLAGLAAQDPYAVVPEQEKLSDEPYGIGANKDDVDLIRFINHVLDERRTGGAWQASYNQWLAPYLGKGTPPAPQYGR